ncbi:fumarate reductase flavoprotein subunit [Tetragenococcus muriaticus PMC-11-5]|uniref:Fumarate reductase flavoprotein subunit n=2 Tax=Tetragenococcus muriaticus TaxID=64642 RepID=A0A091C8X2_9ENTE|nr:fumarate reductase flavoprotein subunit [Tetragenococcus muriaticus 3MR10-3]KFN93366.1 fumarate reductase flavoprotein subunit [Tetragenococcus muriaticus PMC-11-5]
MGGVKINTDTEVLDEDEQAVSGLYAAGELTGGLHGNNRIGGNAVADIIIFGRQAGTQATKFAQENN